MDIKLRYQELSNNISTKWLGKQIIYKIETGSTNDDVKKEAIEHAPHGTIVIAEKQTNGKGRRGRDWDTKEKSIALSMLLRPSFQPNIASMITLVTALSIAKALEKIGCDNVQIKWPNDILVNKKKVCGILTEMSMEDKKIQYMVVGFGINVNMSYIPEHIKHTATSLLLEMNQEVSRFILIEEILILFEQYYEHFCKLEDLSIFLNEYNDLLINRGTLVKVLEPTGNYEGISKGINFLGELLVETADGKCHKVFAGEVSVRGIDGYV